ncbi:MAG TPA: TIGR00282 family metallophosphoesterase [Acholeplasmataceae bacterium]|jgi:metallophosphoesterase (TIGR00282 family)|nr:TIGR00282 family metallophosphoesterase [Acholeplasmataceae bacterium]
MKILIVGDVFSKLGRTSFEKNVKKIKEKEKIDFIIVNGENTSHGRGMNENHYRWYMDQGVDVITLGNHAYHNKALFNIIDDVNNIVRPYNFPAGSPGKGYTTNNLKGLKITVLQVIGKVFMNQDNYDPFKAAQEVLDNVKSDIYICDFHGEATSEKIAFAYAFDGKIQVIFGTHTHVQTNDARILEKGTAYITDVGMTGALEGVIGVKKEIIIDRYLNDGMQRFSPQNTGQTQFSAILVEIDENSKKAANIDIINVIE